MALSPGEMIKAEIGKLETESGRKFADWVKLTKQQCSETGHTAIVKWLKSTQGIKHNQALWVAWGITDPARITAYDDGPALMNNLYSGKKEQLRPVYDKLQKEGLKLGKDVSEICCKTYSSLRNRAQFAIINPRTQSAVDLELAMPPGTKASGKLEAFKGNNEKFTHRIRIGNVQEVDKEVLAAMKIASDHVRGK